MNRIRELREDMALRQIDVAEATGIDQKPLSNYQTGKTHPDAKAMMARADFIHVSIDYLLGRAELPSLNAKLIADEISKAQMQLERIKKDLQ